VRLEKLYRLDRSWFWILSALWFLIIEIALRVRLSVIFWTAFGWFLILQWQAKKFFGIEFSSNPLWKILKSFYYAFVVTLVVFLVFSLLNAMVRAFDPEFLFFQLP